MNEKKSGARSALDAGDYDVVSTSIDWTKIPDDYIDPHDMPRTAAPGTAPVGKKSDDGKIRLDLIPPSMILGVGHVLTFGAAKYGDRNWERGISWGRVYAAALRHLNDWWGGEDYDPETKRSHLEHALCCIAFLNEFRATHPEMDDRPMHAARARRAAS